MIIRQAKKGDISEVLRLYKQENWLKEGYDTDFIQNNPDTYLLIAEEKGRLVATAQLNIVNTLAFGSKPYGVVEFVVTDKDERCRGYMRAIFRRIDEICKDKDCESVMLTSGANRKVAHLFYNKMGYSAAVKGFRKEF